MVWSLAICSLLSERLPTHFATFSLQRFCSLGLRVRFQAKRQNWKYFQGFNRISGFRFLVSGFEFQVSGLRFRVSGFCFRILVFGFQVSGFGFQVSGLGFQISGFEIQLSGFKFQVSGFGLRVLGFRFRIPGFGFRVSSFGSRVSGFRFQVSGFGSEFQVSGLRFRLRPHGDEVRLLSLQRSALLQKTFIHYIFMHYRRTSIQYIRTWCRTRQYTASHFFRPSQPFFLSQPLTESFCWSRPHTNPVHLRHCVAEWAKTYSEVDSFRSELILANSPDRPPPPRVAVKVNLRSKIGRFGLIVGLGVSSRSRVQIPNPLLTDSWRKPYAGRGKAS